ncbi:MAG: response regulator [Bacteroidota bacterium]
MKNSIFYADDDIDDLDIFKEVADELSATVSLFDHGEKLLNALDNPPPQATVIFLDLNMPGKSGFDVLKDIKESEAHADKPVVILSTASNMDGVEKCKEMGAGLYICKPRSMKDLKDAVNYVLNIDWTNFNPSDKEFFYKAQ